MFRTTFALTLLFSLSSAVVVAQPSLGLDAEGVSPGGNTSTQQITQDYVRTQLDWRSYYLNRMAVRRYEPSQGATTWGQPPAARTN